MSVSTVLQLCLLFGSASLMSIGGGNSVVPEIELQAVGTYHWLTQGQFADLFALAQAAPGPSILLVTLVGYSVAGIAGAVVATTAMVVPAGLLVKGHPIHMSLRAFFWYWPWHGCGGRWKPRRGGGPSNTASPPSRSA